MESKRRDLLTISLVICLTVVIFGVLIFSLMAFTNVFNNGEEQSGLFDKSTQKTETITGDLPDDFDILVEAWNSISEVYVNKNNLDTEKLSQGAVRGMINALDDPYSAYVDPETYELELSSLKGKYQGIGAYINSKDERLTVVAPMEGSPAERAGIKSGDIILEINGESTEGMNATEAALKIQGPKGTSVTLLIYSEGDEEPREIVVTRDEIMLESVTWEMHDTIAHIRLAGFKQTTNQDLTDALKQVIDEGAEGIILDVRNNPGGLLDAAVNIGSNFLDGGTFVDVVDSNGVHRKIDAQRGGIATEIPLVVLVNEASASASEVLAGALQDYERAKLIGTKTFGKGSVQVIKMLDDGSALHLTTARWLTPLERPIEGVGLTPDIPSDLKGDDLVDWAVEYLKDEVAGKTLVKSA
jgi:carboxyl-terminal processing protease